MSFYLSNKIKFILKSFAYYFPFLSTPFNRLLKSYNDIEYAFIFKNKEHIYYPITKKLKIKLDKQSFLTKLMLNDFEYVERLFVTKLLSEGDVVFDVGANIGIYSLLCSESVGDSGMVYAFEPIENTVVKLKQNIEYNSCKNINVIQAALSNTSNEAIEMFENENGFDAFNSIVKPVSNNATNIVVKTITIDDFIEINKVKTDVIKLIKIDVEGWEINVLKGAKNLIENNKSIAFLIEFNKDDIQKNTEVFRYMNQFGYNWYVFDVATSKLITYENEIIISSINLIAINENFKQQHPIFF